MMRTFRIVFCILAVLCAASAILVGVLVHWTWCLLLVAGTIAFTAAMLFCKSRSEKPEDTPSVDFEMDFEKKDDNNK